MAINLATFKARYPEFLNAPDTLIAACMSEAVTMCPVSVWGAGGDSPRDLTQQGVFLYTAQFLSESPFARHMNLVADGASPYKARIDTLKRIVASGHRVLAG